MRRATLIFSLLIFIFIFTPKTHAQIPEPESELTETSFPPLPLEPQLLLFPDEEFVRVGLKVQLGTANIQERRWWYRSAERYAPFETAPPADWKVRAVSAGDQIDPSLQSGTVIYNWTSLGPNGDYDVSGTWGPPGAKNQGRATAVWTHMNGPNVVNKNVIFLGTADGGVWKTLNGGDTWTSLTDLQPTLSIGAIDVLPKSDTVKYRNAIIYVGTGEGNFSQPDKDGIGVLKSTDGGAHFVVQTIPWRTDQLGFVGLHRIRRLRIDKNVSNASNVWVAGDGGVYRTTNGGTSWSLVTTLPYSGAPITAPYPGGCWNEYATDFAIDTTTNPSTLYAVFGNIRDNACVNPASDARKNNGIFRSTDGGATWQKISISGSNGFPAIPGDVGRIAIQMAPSNPKHIYVQIAKASDFTSLGIWDTLDATANPVQWSAGSTTNYVSQQGWYDMTGAVDPTNENKIIVGGLDNYISSDRGVNLTQISRWNASDTSWAHADHHHAIFVDATTYYDANDGGLNIGSINGDTATWTHKNIGGLSTLQFYGLGQSATDPYKINAGLQDNGHALLSGGRWRATFGGDGGFAATDQTNDNEAYEEYVYAAIRNSDDGGNTWPTAGCMQAFGTPICTGCLGLCVPDNHTAFIANFMLDTHNQNIMYVGTNYLYRNIDARNAGKVWLRITSDGINGDFVNGSTSSRAYIQIIHTPKASPVGGNPAISQIIYVGTSTGRIWKTVDGGSHWTDLTKYPLPTNSPITGRALTWIDTDPNDANKVVVTYSGWNNWTVPSLPGHVFRSLDGGNSWLDISGALPDEPFNSVAVNPNSGQTNEIYVASDSGVFLNADGWNGTSWYRTNSGLLPYVSVNMLQFTNATTPKKLRAVTHGRGIWEMTKECAAKVTLDKSTYGCSDTVNITVQESLIGAGNLSVQVFSAAEPTPETITVTETPAGSGHYIGSIPISKQSAVRNDHKISVFNADKITVRYVDSNPCPGTPATIDATAATNCNACGGGGGQGPNLEIDASTAQILVLGGDNDEFLDNCETGKIVFNVKNIGSAAQTNVRISKVTPTNSAITLPAMPIVIASNLAKCATAPATLTFTAKGLASNETLQLAIEVTSNELAANGITRSITVQYANSEQDFTAQSSKTFSFESDLEGWRVVNGTFNRTNSGGGANGSLNYLASSSLTDSACDEAQSPVIKLSSNSTLSLYNQFSTEPMSDAWYDRANVGIVDLSNGTRTNVAPSGGRTYLATGPNGVCVTGGQPGWAGPGPAWVQSTWTATDLKSSQFANKKVVLDVGYGTDSSVSLLGFWFDEVTLTNFQIQTADAQSNSCP
jgi:hypothetical protein